MFTHSASLSITRGSLIFNTRPHINTPFFALLDDRNFTAALLSWCKNLLCFCFFSFQGILTSFCLPRFFPDRFHIFPFLLFFPPPPGKMSFRQVSGMSFLFLSFPGRRNWLPRSLLPRGKSEIKRKKEIFFISNSQNRKNDFLQAPIILFPLFLPFYIIKNAIILIVECNHLVGPRITYISQLSTVFTPFPPKRKGKEPTFFIPNMGKTFVCVEVKTIRRRRPNNNLLSWQTKERKQSKEWQRKSFPEDCFLMADSTFLLVCFVPLSFVLTWRTAFEYILESLPLNTYTCLRFRILLLRRRMSTWRTGLYRQAYQ